MPYVRSRINFILLSIALFTLLCPMMAQAEHSTPSDCLSPANYGIELTDGAAKIDVEIIENQAVRVHVQPDGKTTARTLVVDPHPVLRLPSAINRSEQNGSYKLSAAGITVRIQKTRPYSITFLNSAGQQLLLSADPLGEARNGGVTMTHGAGDMLYGIHGLGREDTSVGLMRNDGGRVAAGIQGDSGAPFVFSTSYGLLVESDGGEFTNGSGKLSFQHSSRADVEYFVFAGPPLQTMGALSRLAGPPPLPPKWTLGFINSQWGSTQAEVENIIATYRQKNLPVDGFILDFDWKAWGEDNYGEWRWNSTSGAGNVAPDKFPGGDTGDFAREMSAEGIKLGGILKPRILLTVAGDSEQPTQAAAYATEHNFWYPGEPAMPDYFSHRPARDIDFNNLAARAWFWQHLEPAFRAGMVAWWNDEADLSGKTIFNNFQFLNMGRTIYEGQRASSDLRVWSINRNFYLGSSRYGYAGWSGDIGTGFASMAFQRRRMLAALNTGEFHWSMDTGGFSGHPSPENYARWMEFAAFAPIMRVHGSLNEKRQPWVYGPIAEAAAKQALDLRYQLLPYIYSYERLNTEGEVGIVRPLFWEFPSDPNSARQENEWMFGDALLVAPVVNEGATDEQVYLPAGNWFNYASGQRYDGNQTISIATDATTWKDIPLFVRSGSIVATQPVEEYVGQQQIKEITLDVFPARSAATFTSYDDDGETYNYEKGRYLRQQMTAQQNGNTIQLKIDGATGNYTGLLHTYLLRIHAAATRVTLNGKLLPAASASVTLDRPATSWTSERDKFGHVIEMRVAAGGKAPMVITLQ